MLWATVLVGMASSPSPAADFIRVQPAPDEFVVRQFRDADVVFLGEDHGVKEHLDFVSALIPRLDAAGVHTLGVEFGAEEDQLAADKLLTQASYDAEEARRLQFSYNVGWAIQEYQNLYQAAWKVNRLKREGQTPFRIVHLSYRFNWSKFSGRHSSSFCGVFARGPIEAFRANVIEREAILPRRKMLALVGTPHAYTRYTPMTFNVLAQNYLDSERRWLGQLVEGKAPGRTRTVMFHQPFFLTAPRYSAAQIAGGKLEAAWVAAGGRPVGIDLATGAVGELMDREAVPITESSDRGGVRLKDWADGMVVLKRLRDLKGGTVDRSFVSEANLKAVQSNWPDPDWTPAPKSVTEYYETVGRYLDLSRRYAGL